MQPRRCGLSDVAVWPDSGFFLELPLTRFYEEFSGSTLASDDVGRHSNRQRRSGEFGETSRLSDRGPAWRHHLAITGPRFAIMGQCVCPRSPICCRRISSAWGGLPPAAPCLARLGSLDSLKGDVTLWPKSPRHELVRHIVDSKVRMVWLALGFSL